MLDQQIHRLFDDRRQVAVGNAVAEQILTLAQLVSQRAAGGARCTLPERSPSTIAGKRRAARATVIRLYAASSANPSLTRRVPPRDEFAALICSHRAFQGGVG
jgi:hypothetical protein